MAQFLPTKVLFYITMITQFYIGFLCKKTKKKAIKI